MIHNRRPLWTPTKPNILQRYRIYSGNPFFFCLFVCLIYWLPLRLPRHISMNEYFLINVKCGLRMSIIFIWMQLIVFGSYWVRRYSCIFVKALLDHQKSIISTEIQICYMWKWCNTGGSKTKAISYVWWILGNPQIGRAMLSWYINISYQHNFRYFWIVRKVGFITFNYQEKLAI